jgi:hypothetical protein
MARTSLEERLTLLERRVNGLEAIMAQNSHFNDWRSTIGMFGDDPIMKEIFDEALKIRERDREQARRRWARDDKRKARRT